MRQARQSLRRGSVLAAFIAFAATGCSGTPPDLTAQDLPMEYTQDDGQTALLSHCQGQNIMERYGEAVADKSFQSADELHYVGFVLVKATDDRLMDELIAAAEDCDPGRDTDIGEATILTSDVNVAPVDGPTLGDASQWLETHVQTSVIPTGLAAEAMDPSNATSMSHSVLVQTGDYVFQVSATDLSQVEVAVLADKIMDTD